MPLRRAALLAGSDFHLLDHIAPLAYLWQMPLFVNDPILHKMAVTYYPMVDVVFSPTFEEDLSYFANHFDQLVSCTYWPIHLASLFWDLYGKKMELLFCPHGQSDKGFVAPLLEPYRWQGKVLLYGKLLQDMLEKLHIEVRGEWIGNYRLRFYQEHRAFYDDLVEKEIFSHLPKQPTILYAPTWKDGDGATSFFAKGREILQVLPPSWNLLIKPHPLLEARDPALYYATLQGPLSSNVSLLSSCPLVYPILARVDRYLGDASSVGYDFLHFARPMFFFPCSGHRGRLLECGTIVEDTALVFGKDPPCRREAQQALYAHAF